mmetsp:Transcript_13832/g.33488  ORF Transcript_13832/g.33488 Transcript_13832/m.33488 type:complete len:249 (+) Transcript_13832:1061-1807(+)
MLDSGASIISFQIVAILAGLLSLVSSSATAGALADEASVLILDSCKLSNIRNDTLNVANTENNNPAPYAGRSPYSVKRPPVTDPNKKPSETDAACLPNTDPIISPLPANRSAIKAFATIIINPPITTFTIREIHILHTPGCNTTPKLAHAIIDRNITVGTFLPKLSMNMPTNGERKSSMDADMAERRDRIWTARACGEDVDDVEDDIIPSARCFVNEGNGEKTTMDVDATIRKDVRCRALIVLDFRSC